MADLIDFCTRRIYLQELGLWVHHLVIIAAFSASLVTKLYSPYLAATMLVELNGVFLHQRKLFLLSGFLSKNRLYTINSYLLLFTNLMVRIPVHGWVTWRVVQEWDLFLAPWHRWLALSAMLVLNFLNVQLVEKLVRADRRIFLPNVPTTATTATTTTASTASTTTTTSGKVKATASRAS